MVQPLSGQQQRSVKQESDDCSDAAHVPSAGRRIRPSEPESKRDTRVPHDLVLEHRHRQACSLSREITSCSPNRCADGRVPGSGLVIAHCSSSVELEASQQKHRAVLARSGEGICLLDPETKEVIEANDTFWRVFRLEPATLDAGRLPIIDLLPDVNQAGHATSHQCQYQPADGSARTLSVTVQRVSYGSDAALCAVIQDVTEHVHAQSALTASEERYALTAQGASDALWDWDLKSGTVHLSPRWNEMLGLPHQPGTSLDTWLGRLHPDDRRSFDQTLQEFQGGQTAEFQHGHRVRHVDGTYRWVLCRGVSVRDGDGTPSRMAGSQTDITSLRASEAQLQHAASRIRDLKELAVQLYLDDFGTGYSSLSYLHRFPLDVIKIDQSFIHRMEASVKDDTLVGAIIRLAKKPGMDVIAEGVETAAQFKQLQTTPCDVFRAISSRRHRRRATSNRCCTTSARADRVSTTCSNSVDLKFLLRPDVRRRT